MELIQIEGARCQNRAVNTHVWFQILVHREFIMTLKGAAVSPETSKYCKDKCGAIRYFTEQFWRQCTTVYTNVHTPWGGYMPVGYVELLIHALHYAYVNGHTGVKGIPNFLFCEFFN